LVIGIPKLEFGNEKILGQKINFYKKNIKMTTFNLLGTLVTQTCHSSWCGLFNSSLIQQELLNIKNNIGNNFTPQSSDIFKVFQKDLNNCKVVILGQDPYPQSGVATGRAFEVGNITHWNQIGNNASLRNILKLLYKNHSGSQTIESIDKVRKNISFISLPNQLFTNWENQGVLLLNTALTCPQGTANESSNAHAKYWKTFTEETIKFIDSNTQGVTWFLWGKGRGFCNLISNGIKYCSEHPRNNDDKNPVQGTFYYENHFSKVTSITWI
jgi:uracil-DNA glycosylase